MFIESTIPSYRLSTLAHALRLGPVGFGGAVLGGLLAGFALWELALGRVTLSGIPSDRGLVLHGAIVALTHIVCTAYLMGALVQAHRSADLARARLRPLLGPGRDLDMDLCRTADRGVLFLMGALGVGAWLGLTLISPGPVSLDPRE